MMNFRCEVLRVLLLLLIEPTASQTLSPELTSILDKYTWESQQQPQDDDDSAATAAASASEDTLHYLSEEMFLLLQSVVMAAQIRDASALRSLEDCLAPMIESQPRALLRNLVDGMQEKAA